MDTAQWLHQEIVLKPMEEIIVVPNSTTNITTTAKQQQQQQQQQQPNSNGLEKKLARPQKEQAINCPRCNSTNTKFCYYNNYSLSQPRYFCKTCRRYWTEGGSLRNIPVGGGSRKNKRSSSTISSTSNSNSASTSSSSSSKKLHQLPDLILPPMSSSSHLSHQNPNSISKMIHLDHGQDLNLGFAHDFKTISELIQVPNYDQHHNNGNMNGKDFSTTTSTSNTTNSSTNGGHLSALELLTRGGGLNSFLPSIPPGSSVFPGSSAGMFLPEFKPSSLSFSLDGLGIGSSSLHGSNVQDHQSSSGRLLFPFEDLKQVSTTNSTTSAGENRDRHGTGGDTTGYWSGILGGGGVGGGGSNGAGGVGGSW